MISRRQSASNIISPTERKSLFPMNSPETAFVEFEKVRSRTVVCRAYAQSPLRILVPRSLGSEAWIYTSNYGGGYVGGDQIHLKICVNDHAKALILTQSTTKIFRSPRRSCQFLTAEVKRGGSLMLAPDPVSCYRGSDFHQKQRIDLEDGASLLLVDSFTSGRRAYGEFWSFDRFQNQIEVFREDNPIFLESLLLDAKFGSPFDRLRPFEAFGLILWFGPEFESYGLETLKASVEFRPNCSKNLYLSDGSLIAPSRLSREGVIVRVATLSAQNLVERFKVILFSLLQRFENNPFEWKW